MLRRVGAPLWWLARVSTVVASLVTKHDSRAETSAVVAHRLRDPTAGAVFLDQGSNLCLLR